MAATGRILASQDCTLINGKLGPEPSLGPSTFAVASRTSSHSSGHQSVNGRLSDAYIDRDHGLKAANQPWTAQDVLWSSDSSQSGCYEPCVMKQSSPQARGGSTQFKPRDFVPSVENLDALNVAGTAVDYNRNLSYLYRPNQNPMILKR